MIAPQDIKNAVAKRRRQIIDFLVEVIRIPSETGDEERVSKFISQFMTENGLRVQVVEAQKGRPNLLATWKGSRGPQFVFNGHMDVVPAGPTKEWLYDPWSGKIVDDHIYGRGAVDMKSGLCSSIMAVILLKEIGFSPKGSVLITCTCDEETGGELGVKHLLKKGLIAGDFGLNCEPTSLNLMLTHRGIYRADFTVKGKAVHGGVPWLGVDAIEKSIKVMNRLYELRDQISTQNHPVLGKPTLIVSTIQAGTCPNMLASNCSFTVDRRLIESYEAAEEEVLGIFEELKAKDRSLTIAIG